MQLQGVDIIHCLQYLSYLMKFLFIFLLLSATLLEVLPQPLNCHILCQQCDGDTCQSCYENFQANSDLNSSCNCPEGFYPSANLCKFNPDYCEIVGANGECEECFTGYVQISGQCLNQKYIEEATWVAYSAHQDFSIASTGSYSKIGFTSFPDSDSNFLECSSTQIFSNPILVWEVASGDLRIDKSINGLPFHQWAHLRIQYAILDSFSGSTINVTMGDNEDTIVLHYNNSQRIRDICGGNQADNMDQINVYQSSATSSLTISIQLSAVSKIGISALILDVGTCPRNCLRCEGPQKCIECDSIFELNETNGLCQCNLTLSYPVSYGCLQKCPQGYFFIQSLERCILSDRYIPNCLTLRTTVACEQCMSHYFVKENGQCTLECPLGFYANKTDIFSCERCQQNCTSCLAEDFCLTCESGFFLNGKGCVEECPAGTFVNGNRCYGNQVFDGCSQYDASSRCTECSEGFWLVGDRCDMSCPSLSFPSLSSDTCQSCSPNCYDCLDSETCFSCSFGYVLENGACALVEQNCLTGEYYDRTVARCVECPSHCETCFKSLCYSCEDTFFLDNGECLPECTDEKVVTSNISNVCRWRSPLCESYDEQGFCEDCRELDYVLSLDLGNKMCQINCPAGMMEDSRANDTCIEDQYAGENCWVSRGTQCLACTQGYSLSSGGDCVQSCGDGWMSDSTQCIPCPSGCTTCDIGGGCSVWSETPSLNCTSNCNKCLNNVCVECDGSTFLDLSTGQCLLTCLQSYFSDKVSRQCLPCKPGCLSCSNFRTCSNCVEGFFSFGSTCLQECPSGTYAELASQKCEPCSSNCKTCFGGKEHQCLTCFYGYKKDHTECVSSCPVHRYEDSYGHCDWCHESCRFCYGPADFQCLECDHGNYLYKGQCYVGSCPASTYLAVPSIRECEDCSWGCATCTSPHHCTQCHGGFYLQNGHCLSACSQGLYPTSSQCSLCPENCVSCFSNSCYNCQSGFNLHNGQCQQHCPDGTYVLDYYYGRRCSTCPSQCSLCTSSFQCSSCNSGYTLLNNQCVKHCESGFYFNSQNDSCSPCVDHCLSCASEYCMACSSGYLLNRVNGQCVQLCEEGYYENNRYCEACATHCLHCSSFYSCAQCEQGYNQVNGVCVNGEQCTDPHCSTCSDESSCLVCENGYYLLMQSQTCVSQCPEGTYTYGDICVSCSSSCSSCSAHQGCTRCTGDLTLYHGQCYPSCPPGFHDQNGNCDPCPSHCRTCLDDQTCTSCPHPLILNEDSCIEACPASTYFSSFTKSCLPCRQNCQLCFTPDICVQCLQSNYLNPDGSCSSSCPTGFYKDSQNNECESCSFPCLTCTSESQCIECYDGYPLNTETSQCEFECQQGYFANAENECQACNSNCLTCFNGAIQCTSCNQGFFKMGTQCLLICPDGTYSSADHRACLPCPIYCLECSSSNQCTSCHSMTVLLEGRCLDQCPSQYYYDNEARECRRCLSPCATCQGNSMYECDTCIPGYFLINNRCIENCPTGYYNHILTSTCRPCNPLCLECLSASDCITCINETAVIIDGMCETAPQPCNATFSNCEVCSQSGCLNCFDGFYLQEGECVETCLESTFENDNTGDCDPCQANCQFCDSLTQCVQCASGFYLYQGYCFAECPSGTHQNPTERKCQVDPCIRYDSDNNCTSCVSPFLLHEGACVSQCPNSTFYAELECLECMQGCHICYSIQFCSTCDEGYYLYDGMCRQTCPTGTYPITSYSQCIQCPESCLSCTNYTSCNLCSDGYYMNPSGDNETGTCERTCIEGSYLDDSNDQCKECPSGCQSCRSQESCQVCDIGYIMFDHKCMQQCPEGYTEDQGICKSCMLHCQLCSGVHVCQICEEGYYLHEDHCVLHCPQGTFQDHFNAACQPCNSACSHCDSAEKCSECPQNKYLFYGECLDECPSGYYNMAGDSSCRECDTVCRQCSYSSDNCTQCQNGLVLVDNFCQRHQCSQGHYLRNGTCLDCSVRCNNCFGPNMDQCTSCNSPYLLFQHRCLLECPPGTHANSNGTQCLACDMDCATCSNSSRSCESCPPGKYLNQLTMTCVYACPPGYLQNTSSEACEACSSSCRTCEVEPTRCTSCPNTTILQSGTCISQCPIGQYHLLTNHTCMDCPDLCAQCTDHSTCSECEEGYWLIADICYSECPAGMYEDQASRSCVECQQENCRRCVSATECVSCIDTYLHNGQCLEECPVGFRVLDGKCKQDNNHEDNQSCPHFILQSDSISECVEFCPVSTFKVNETHCQPCSSNCLLCSNSSHCIQCHSNFFMIDGECQRDCPPGTLPFDSQQLCVECGDYCEQCSSHSAGGCSMCQQGYSLLSNGQCVAQCPDGSYSENGVCENCLSSCATCSSSSNCVTCEDPALSPPNCHFLDCLSGQHLQNGTCENCHASCLTCSGSLSTECLSCSSPYVLIHGQCRSTCPEGYYQISEQCRRCSSGCQNCQNSSQCSNCFNPQILHQGQCLYECEELSTAIQAFYEDNSSCEVCPSSCQVCTAEECEQCQDGFILFNSTCLQACPSGYYLSFSLCYPCSQDCLSCTSSEQCSQCSDSRFLHNGMCLQQCPTGFFNNAGKCQQCSLHCQTCSDAQTCTVCKHPYMANNGACSSCADGYIYNANTKTCHQCSTTCRDCEITIGNCTACDTGSILHEGTCLSECPIGYYEADNICQQCISNCEVCSASSCLECMEGFYYNSLSHQCVQVCPDSTYAHDASMQCENCAEECAKCMDEDTCLQCVSPFVLYDEVCRQTCPSSTVNVNGQCEACPTMCRTCSSPSNCTECRPDYYLDEHNSCKERPLCSSAQYYNQSTSACENCLSNCLTCDTSSSCLECNNMTYLNTQEQCVEQCSNGSFGNAERRCEECSWPCRSCSGEADNCSDCMDGFFLNDTSCISSCGEGYYVDNVTCVECGIDNCASCTNTTCLECSYPYYLMANSTGFFCLSECPPYHYTHERSCENCSQNCTRCSSDSQCEECDPGMHLYDGFCHDSCPNSTYPRDEDCVDCSHFCLECSNDNTCMRCQNNTYLYLTGSRDYCVTDCPNRYFGNETVWACQECGDHCFSCSNNSVCEECISSSYILTDNHTCIHENCLNCQRCENSRCYECQLGFFLYNDRCYEECPQTTYADEESGNCENCMEHCTLCNRVDFCIQCDQDYNFTDTTNQCVEAAFLQFGNWSNMSTFTSNVTYYMVAIYLGTSTGPMAFGEMGNTYFNIELCQFFLFHAAASGNNSEMEEFLDSLQAISLSNTGGSSEDNSTDNSTTGRRRMLVSDIKDPGTFLEVNAFIFLLAGIFLLTYLFIFIFQRNADSCCATCPRIFFYVSEICEFMKKRFLWIYFDFVAWIAYIPFIFFALLQLQNFAFNSFLAGLSSILAIVIIVTFPLYPILIVYLLKKNYNALVLENDTIIEMSLKPYVDKVKRPSNIVTEDQEFKYFTFENWRLIYDALKYFRKFIFVLVIAVSTVPVTALSVLIALNVIFIVYMAVFRPRTMPYMVFDFIIEGILLFFEIFMLVYLLNGADKVSAMSIVTHAIGFIFANLSLFIAIILNLIAYYKIIMCIYDLYKHLKEKLAEKQKKELKGQEESEMHVNEEKDKELLNSGKKKRKGDDSLTEEDIDENLKGLMDDKQLFDKLNKGSELNSSIKKSKGGLPDLKKTVSKPGKLEDDDDIVLDKEMGGLGKKRRIRDDDDLTEEDPELKISQGNSNLMRDKELYGKDNDEIRRSKGGEIPDLKASRKPVYRQNLDIPKRPIHDSEEELSLNNSSIDSSQLIKDGFVVNRYGENYRRHGINSKEEVIIADGKLVEKEKDRFRRPQLEKINSVQEPDEAEGLQRKKKPHHEDLLELGNMKERNRKFSKEGGFDSDDLKEGQMKERKGKGQSNKQNDDDDLNEGQFVDRNNKKNYDSKKNNETDPIDVKMKEREQKIKNRNNEDIDELGFNERKKKQKGISGDGDLDQIGFYEKKKRNKNEEQGNINEIGLFQREKGQKGAKGNQRQISKQKQSSKEIQQGNAYERNRNKNKSIERQNRLEEGKMNERERNKKDLEENEQFADFSEESPQQVKSKSKIEEIKAKQRERKKNIFKGDDDDIPEVSPQSRKVRKSKKNIEDQDKLYFDDEDVIQGGNLVERKVDKFKRGQPQQDGQEEVIEGGNLVERKKNKFKRNPFNEEEQEEDINAQMRDIKTKKKNNEQKRASHDEDELQQAQFRPNNPKKATVNREIEELSEEITEVKHINRKKERRQILEDSSELGDQFTRQRKGEKEREKRKSGLLNILDDGEDETYSEIKRKNKDNIFTIDKGKAGTMMQSVVDDFQDSDYERPASKLERSGSRGKGHLGVNESHNYESDQESNSSVRKQRQSAVHRLRKKNDLLKLDERSDYSGDEQITTPRGSIIKKPKKAKREKAGVLNINQKGGNGDDLDEIRL